MRFADGATLFQHYLIRHFFLDGWKSLVAEDRQKKIFPGSRHAWTKHHDGKAMSA